MGPYLVKVAIDRGVQHGDFGVVEVCAAVYFGGVLLAIAAGSTRIYWAARVSERILYRLRVAMFTHLQRLGLDFYTREASGVVMTRMTSDVEAGQALFQEGFASLAIQLLTITFAVTMMFVTNVRLASYTVFGVIPAMLALFFLPALFALLFELRRARAALFLLDPTGRAFQPINAHNPAQQVILNPPVRVIDVFEDTIAVFGLNRNVRSLWFVLSHLSPHRRERLATHPNRVLPCGCS